MMMADRMNAATNTEIMIIPANSTEKSQVSSVQAHNWNKCMQQVFIFSRNHATHAALPEVTNAPIVCNYH